MKKINTLVSKPSLLGSVACTIGAALVFGASSAKSAVIFTESMGTVSATTAIAAHNTAGGFDNDSFTFSGTGDMRNTTPSKDYAGASGDGNVFFTNNQNADFRIDGISTVGYTAGSLELIFGAHKQVNASDMTTLKVEFSTNGESWTVLTFPAQPTGTGTSNWRLVTIDNASIIPITNSLSLRWTNTDTSAQYRLDDVTLTGTPIPEPASAFIGGLFLLGLCRRRSR